jgi:hypothetical protein
MEIDSIGNFFKFEKVLLSRAILDPDRGQLDVISLLACAIFCNRQGCSTINVLLDDTQPVCQMSKKKASCMETKETVVNPGSRMYQTKVSCFYNIQYGLNNSLSFLLFYIDGETRPVSLYYKLFQWYE